MPLELRSYSALRSYPTLACLMRLARGFCVSRREFMASHWAFFRPTRNT